MAASSSPRFWSPFIVFCMSPLTSFCFCLYFERINILTSLRLTHYLFGVVLYVRCILSSHNVHIDTILVCLFLRQSENSMHGIPGENIRDRMVCIRLVGSVGTLTEMQVLCTGTEVRHYTQEHFVLLFLLLEFEPLFFPIISVVPEKIQGINLLRKKHLWVDISPSALCSSYFF